MDNLYFDAEDTEERLKQAVLCVLCGKVLISDIDRALGIASHSGRLADYELAVKKRVARRRVRPRDSIEHDGERSLTDLTRRLP